MALEVAPDLGQYEVWWAGEMIAARRRTDLSSARLDGNGFPEERSVLDTLARLADGAATRAEPSP